MSHTTKITGVQLTDPDARAAAAQAMGMVPPTRERVTMFDGSTHEGVAIRLPGWAYPVVIKDNGEIAMDNFRGHWGDMDLFDQYCQQYTLAVAGVTFYDHSYTTTELPNGDLRVSFMQ